MNMKQVNQQDSHAVWQQVEAIRQSCYGADHIDVKVFEGDVELRQFLANMFSFTPWWLKFLYGVRWLFVRLLGMKQEGIPGGRQAVQPADINMKAGESATFFTVKAAEEDHYYLVGITESHLTAHLAVVCEPVAVNHNRFYVITIVHYHRWTGPVYFNVIRPFHHLVVQQMGQAGVAA